MKRASYSCCIFVCVVLTAAYLKYRRYRSPCLPFVWHFFPCDTHTHTASRILWWMSKFMDDFFLFWSMIKNKKKTLLTCESLNSIGGREVILKKTHLNMKNFLGWDEMRVHNRWAIITEKERKKEREKYLCEDIRRKKKKTETRQTKTWDFPLVL